LLIKFTETPSCIRELTCCIRPTRTHQQPRGVVLVSGHNCSSPGTTPSVVTRATWPRVKMGNLLGLAITSILSSTPCTVTKKIYSYVLNFESVSSVCLGFLAQCCTDSNAPPALVFIRQGRWWIVIFDNDITICHVLRFPLIWQNNGILDCIN
jgi:hypothetical protein